MSHTPELSVIIPIRNRSGVRADNCLRSLRWQQLPSDQVEVLLSDYGSSPDHTRAIAQSAETFGARVIHTQTSELWNRSRALNIAIREAKGTFVMCTDIDMLFREDFLPTVLARLQEDDTRMVVSRCRDLPESVPDQPWQLDDYAVLESKATFRKTHGTGACQATTRAWFEDVRGYDEAYVFWGFEDGDMRARAERSGRKLCWIHEHTSMLHQWHRNVARDKLHWKYINKLRFWLTRHQIRKNGNGWG